MIRRHLLLAAPLLLCAAPALAATTTPNINIRLDDGSVWRTTVKQTSSEGFLRIHNDGLTDDVLTSWSCPNAGQTILMGKDGKALTQLVIPAKTTIALAPGGIYLELKDMQYPVERGSVLPCAFTFQQAGQLGGFLNASKRPKG
ncbi:copper chaperone PCu(A)C [Acidocella sp.]|uniref:copper chaperone PCu(A)C n=1 Tax=Acidocella sp. TaxID=50710 RepID=UPI003D01FFF8